MDSRYDLDKDIDMTINVGGEYLTFPVGSTDTTFLSKLISLEEACCRWMRLPACITSPIMAG